MSGSDSDEVLSVIVPCLNEEELVVLTVEEIMAVAPSLPVRVEVIMVDDGSTDGTRAAMEALCQRYPDNCRMRVNPKNLGGARSVFDTIDELDEDSWVTCFPGDNEMVFECIRNFLDIRKDYDLILGYLQNGVIRTIPRRFGSAAFTQVTRALYGFQWRYLNGIKIYRASVFKGINTVSSGHAANAELIAKAILRDPTLRVGEAPFLARGRAIGTSKAFRPTSIATAMRETLAGYRNVVKFRKDQIKKDQ